MNPLRIGIVGCGAISGIYFENLAKYPGTEVVAVSDLDFGRSCQVAEKQGVRALSTEELFADPEIELVLNLTVPKAHVEVARRSIDAGKHLYSEKPLGIDVQEARELVESAERRGVLIGCAPDTALGAGIQTCREIIDEGGIGRPVAATAFMLSRGHETWHPSPEFYYELGGGPMLDMGPYYVTALVNLLGPISRTCGMTSISFPERTITSQPKAGKVIPVETDTHISGEMEFVSGAIGHITTSFDVVPNPMPHIVIYGSEGTLIVPDPNGFGGEPQLKSRGGEFVPVPLRFGFATNSRGVGVLDMARAIREHARDHRASGHLALHVLEVMQSFSKASQEGRYVSISSQAKRPAPMDRDLEARLNLPG